MSTKTVIIGISPKAAKVINMVKQAVAKSPTGVSFVSIKGYTNQQGEVADHVFNIGADYGKAKEADIKFLNDLDITEGKWSSDMVTMIKAKAELIKNLISPNEARSQALANAYTHICKGVKVHNETGVLYVYGNRVNKVVHVEGFYTEKNKRALTVAKDELRKLLKTSKFRQFIMADATTFKANGETLEIK
jgi:hypothetical protein